MSASLDCPRVVRSRAGRLALGALLTCACGGCFGGSTLVAPEARAVQLETLAPEWRPALPGDIDGLFASKRIEGEAAAALWRLEYWFAPDGTYTGAALVFDGARAAFRTLSGDWSLEGDLLDLHAGPPARASIAGELLRLESDAGVAILQRAGLE